MNSIVSLIMSDIYYCLRKGKQIDITLYNDLKVKQDGSKLRLIKGNKLYALCDLPPSELMLTTFIYSS
jgi:hypothetical protein